MAGEGDYHKALANNKRRLKDYQEVHFRRNTIYESSKDAKFRPVPPRTSIALNTSGSGSGTGITLAPRRTSRAQSQLEGNFTPSTAPLYLRQTEGVWLCPNLSRQEATNALFDRPIGTFIVRNSQKARYALSVRVPKDDPAVSHFLIEANQQGFLTIQGSNLPFLSLYDLLAYFSFYKSGGMPCYLAKPESDQLPQTQPLDLETSDSSESDEDVSEDVSEEVFRSRVYGLTAASSPPTSPPPLVPPHRSTHLPSLLHPRHRRHSHSHPPLREEDFAIHSWKQPNNVRGWGERIVGSRSKSPQSDLNRSPAGSPPLRPTPGRQGVKRPPPPKPPRGSTLLEDEEEEVQKVIRKVDSIVDTDVRKLYDNYRKICLERDRGGGEGERGGGGTGEGEGRGAPGIRRRQLRRELSWSSDDLRRGKRRHVNSLVQQFEKNDGMVSPSPVATTGGGPSRHRLPDSPLRDDSTPLIPPRPRRPPRPPPWGSTSPSDKPPAVPPHTPAPLIPPKPSSRKAPFIPSRERAASDSTFGGKSRPPAPPPGDVPLPPPKTYVVEPHYEFDLELKEKLNAARRNAMSQGDRVRKGREGDRDGEGEGEGEERRVWMSVMSEPGPDTKMNGISGTGHGAEPEREMPGSTATEPSGKDRSKGKKKSWQNKLPKFYRKPRKKIRKFIVDLASDNSTEFGQKVGKFISDIKSHSKDPYQKMLSEIRVFMTQMTEFLLLHHHTDLVNAGMESCNNFEHVMETSLQQCLLRPLSLYVYLRIEEHLMESGSLFQVQRSMHQGKQKTSQEMGIRDNIVVPSDKVMSEIAAIFNRMTKTYCAISKLEFLLEAVRLTYENIRDSKNPKKSMSDLGADDFLPLFVWVLVQSGFTRAEIEAEYMWGLAHPSLFNGEAGYYLTTLTSAINVLKETQPAVPAFPLRDSSENSIEEQIQNLPCMNNLQTELKIFFEDASTGQYSSAYRLAVVPDMTVAEVCEVVAQKHCKPNPHSYGLFTVVDGHATEMSADEKPQEVKKHWALERSFNKNPARQPSTRFIAYKLKQT